MRAFIANCEYMYIEEVFVLHSIKLGNYTHYFCATYDHDTYDEYADTKIVIQNDLFHTFDAAKEHLIRYLAEELVGVNRKAEIIKERISSIRSYTPES